MSTETKIKEVKTSSDAAESLRGLYVHSLKDIYWAEQSLSKSLPAMIENATTESLKKSLKDQDRETDEQISRLEKVFNIVGEKAEGEKCEAMDGLVKEAKHIMETTEKGSVRDAGIIAASQKIKHYEIATYGILCSFSKTLGYDDVAEILHESLREEKAADQSLTDNAYNDINFEATE
ncbi:YciE/YciF ferroxidase family protein [Flavobacterium litorale]|uniref:Ferritin-like domain-containing protein n=1 Tax=Flavobacterium litorale TaxID=2856519 RepID=A0ABX8V4Z3_9FLAO|nr:ferritin-like domain-containing protein [Flavobacterium litorale]QYJ67865.1 ferritin-like domain-containing protein [Flavobacterium litorale]